MDGAETLNTVQYLIFSNIILFNLLKSDNILSFYKKLLVKQVEAPVQYISE